MANCEWNCDIVIASTNASCSTTVNGSCCIVCTINNRPRNSVVIRDVVT